MNGIRLNLNSQKVFNRKGCSRASNLERRVFPGYQGPMVELTTLPSEKKLILKEKEDETLAR